MGLFIFGTIKRKQKNRLSKKVLIERDTFLKLFLYFVEKVLVRKKISPVFVAKDAMYNCSSFSNESSIHSSICMALAAL